MVEINDASFRAGYMELSAFKDLKNCCPELAGQQR